MHEARIMDTRDDQLAMDEPEVIAAMKGQARAEARQAELVRAFLLDLEHEYSKAHRVAFQAQWGLGARPRSLRAVALELAIPCSTVELMVDDGLMYARKWFGVDDGQAAQTVPLVRAA
ncbi:MAG: hypothetical protein U0166_20895 [Acidobacteriota bacterium]